MFGIVGYLINRFGHLPTTASAVPTNKHFKVGLILGKLEPKRGLRSGLEVAKLHIAGWT